MAAIAVQVDGKILVGGWFNASGGGNYFLTRLNANGTTDGTFGFAYLGGQVYAIVVQPDGKFIVGGQSNADEGNVVRINADGTTAVNAVGRNFVARVNADGPFSR